MSWTSLWGNWPSSWAAVPGAIMESAPASAASTPVPCQGCGWALGAPRPPTPCRPTCWAGSPRPSRSCSLCCWTGPLTCSWTTSESGARGPPSARDATATAAGPALPCPAPTPQPRPQSRQACCAAAFIQLSQRRTGPEVASQARRRSSSAAYLGCRKTSGRLNFLSLFRILAVWICKGKDACFRLKTGWARGRAGSTLLGTLTSHIRVPGSQSQLCFLRMRQQGALQAMAPTQETQASPAPGSRIWPGPARSGPGCLGSLMSVSVSLCLSIQ